MPIANGLTPLGTDCQPWRKNVVMVDSPHFNNSNSMTTGVFAWMLWRWPVGMWTQVPAFASCLSSPSVPPGDAPMQLADGIDGR
jgi:hypothetical protein